MNLYKEKEKELEAMFERLSELNGTIQAHHIYTENNFAFEGPDPYEYLYLVAIAGKCEEFLNAYDKIAPEFHKVFEEMEAKNRDTKSAEGFSR